MKRVLVIDDDESIRGAIGFVLRHQGLDVVLVDGVQAGMEAFWRQPFDVVLVDIFMPGTCGLEAIKNLRARRPSIPIVAMSGFRFRNTETSGPDFLKLALERGASHCLSKPFTPQQLIAAIDASAGDRTPDQGTVLYGERGVSTSFSHESMERTQD